MANWEHFHQILSKRFLFPLKVGKAKTFANFLILFLDVLSNSETHYWFTIFTDSKYNEGKSRPKLTDAVFNKEVCKAEILFLKCTSC